MASELNVYHYANLPGPYLQYRFQSFTLVGQSRAAYATVFWLKELDIQFDAGAFIQSKVPSTILLTHCHADHSVTIPRQKSFQFKPQIYLPESQVSNVFNFMNMAERFWTSESDFSYIPADHGSQYDFQSFELIPCTPHDTYYIKKGTIQVEIIECFHQVPCIGFGLSRKTEKLKPEYMGRSSVDLGLLRKNGVVFTDTIWKPMIVYLGDTDERVLANENIYKYPVIIIECTFLFDEELPRAAQTQHIHYTQLRPILEKYQDITFVLIHFSLRYTVDEIRQFFKTTSHKNILVWV